MSLHVVTVAFAALLLLPLCGRAHFLLERTIRNFQACQSPNSNEQDRKQNQSDDDSHKNTWIEESDVGTQRSVVCKSYRV